MAYKESVIFLVTFTFLSVPLPISTLSIKEIDT